jgi:hypothetical protein
MEDLHFPVHGVRVPCAQFFNPKTAAASTSPSLRLPWLSSPPARSTPWLDPPAMDVAQEASAPPCVVPFLHGRELFPCCDYLPRTARSGLPMAVVCNKKSHATCSLFCAATPTSSRAVGSLFCGAPWTARRRRLPCVRCFAQPHPRRRKSLVRFLAALAAVIFFCAR